MQRSFTDVCLSMGVFMQKIFYVSKSADGYGDRENMPLPDMDRFQRVEKLNRLLETGWSIKDFKTDNDGSFFVLEKGEN